MKKHSKKKVRTITIGRTEKLDFPELDLKQVSTKIDTGAYTSSMHCTDIALDESGKEPMVRFKLDLGTKEDVEHVMPLVRRKVVKSSFGNTEERFTIRTKVRLIRRTLSIEFALTDRAEMKYPILIGRKFLKKGFIVDVNKKDHIRTSKRKLKRKARKK
jgi:hypothetical protein